MNDRELLELAAKAAGIRLHVWGTKGAENFADMDAKTDGRWNPLADDGDAFRLAVRLSMTIDIGGDSSEAVTPIHWYVEQHEGDPMAATRRAIVRAAAEIGKQSNA